MSYQSKYTGAAIDTSVDTTQKILNMIYPIGSVYMSVNNVSPASFIGGTWERIQDRFLVAAGSSYGAGTSGGAASHTHTSAAHTHTLSDAGWGYLSMGGDGIINMIYSYNSGSWTGNWKINGSSSQSYSKNSADGIVLGGKTDSTTPGNTGSSSNLPPYLSIYMWKRTA